MSIKQDIEIEIKNLEDKLYTIALLTEQVWAYHPANPDFVNPISLYEFLNSEINVIERKINFLECELNALN